MIVVSMENAMVARTSETVSASFGRSGYHHPFSFFPGVTGVRSALIRPACPVRYRGLGHRGRAGARLSFISSEAGSFHQPAAAANERSDRPSRRASTNEFTVSAGVERPSPHVAVMSDWVAATDGLPSVEARAYQRASMD